MTQIQNIKKDIRICNGCCQIRNFINREVTLVPEKTKKEKIIKKSPQIFNMNFQLEILRELHAFEVSDLFFA